MLQAGFIKGNAPERYIEFAYMNRFGELPIAHVRLERLGQNSMVGPATGKPTEYTRNTDRQFIWYSLPVQQLLGVVFDGIWRGVPS